MNNNVKWNGGMNNWVNIIINTFPHAADDFKTFSKQEDHDGSISLTWFNIQWSYSLHTKKTKNLNKFNGLGIGSPKEHLCLIILISGQYFWQDRRF